MKSIYLNLKRFDVPSELGGINRQWPIAEYGARVIHAIGEELARLPDLRRDITVFLPEAHITGAVAMVRNRRIRIGCQSVHHDDVGRGGNFGALTAGRSAAAMRALGCQVALVGHSEERRELLAIAGADRADSVNRVLGERLRRAAEAGLDVVYCVGETADERPDRDSVIAAQLESCRSAAGDRSLVIAYEPVWAIGPGKTPPGPEEIGETARFIRSVVPDTPIVYGGGLKQENARMIAAIEEIGGGLVALTRFTGDFGFYPDEFAEIVRAYAGGRT